MRELLEVVSEAMEELAELGEMAYCFGCQKSCPRGVCASVS